MSKIPVGELAGKMRKNGGATIKQTKAFVNEMFDIIQENLARDGIVKVKGLGTFKVIDVDERESVNVNTGERVTIKKHSKITFTADSAMKDLVNKPFSQFDTVMLNADVEFDDQTLDALDISQLADEEENVIAPLVDTTESSEEQVEEPETVEKVEEEPAAVPVVEDEIVEEEPVAAPVVVEELVEEEPVAAPVVEEEIVKEEPAAAPVLEEEIVEEEPVAAPVVEEEIVEEEPAAAPVVEEEIVEEEPAATPVVEDEIVEEEPAATPVVEEEIVEEEPAATPVVEEEVVEEESVTAPVVEEEVVEEEPVTAPVVEEEMIEDKIVEDETVEEETAEPDPFEKNRRIALFVIAGVALFVCVLGYFLYDNFFRAEPVAEVANTEVQSIAEKTTPANRPTESPVAEPVAEPAAEPVAEPVAEPMTPEPQQPAPASEQPTETPSYDLAELKRNTSIYAAIDKRILNGTYYIVGLDYEVKAKKGDTPEKVARRVFGGKMSPYICAYNGFISDTLALKPGQAVRVPKLVAKSKVK